MNRNQHNHKQHYTLQDFMPLIIIFAAIVLFTFLKASITGQWDTHSLMNDFMAAFFLVFGTFKVINLEAFAQAYSTYDLIAKQSKFYAYAYPFIELTLGILYLLRWYPTLTNIITLIVMLVSAAGVFNELRKKRTVMCACLGVVFKIPMTYVTLAEDLLMAVMALFMLIR